MAGGHEGIKKDFIVPSDMYGMTSCGKVWSGMVSYGLVWYVMHKGLLWYGMVWYDIVSYGML